MTRTRIYLLLQAAMCILLVAMLSVSAVTIYREGVIRRAEHPLEPVYTREIVAEKAAPLAPLFFTAVGLMIAGLVLGIKDENADKAVRDSELNRDLIIARVAQPTQVMRKAKKAQRLLLAAGWGVFFLCMLPIVKYVADPAHFPQEDLEGMFHGLLRVFLPWTAVGLGVLVVFSLLRERYVLREIEAAKERIKEEKETGINAEPKNVSQQKNPGVLQIVLIVAAIGFIIAGVLNGSARDVLYKAINICTECVGLG